MIDIQFLLILLLCNGFKFQPKYRPHGYTCTQAFRFLSWDRYLSHRCKMNMMTVYFHHFLLSFVSLASGKTFSPAVHDELVNILLKDYNAHTVPMNVGDTQTLRNRLYYVFFKVFKSHNWCGCWLRYNQHRWDQRYWSHDCYCMVTADLDRFQVILLREVLVSARESW